MPTDASVTSLPPPVGRGFARVDGPLKVAGVARYSSDHHFPGMLYAVPLGAPIAKGRIERLDPLLAEDLRRRGFQVTGYRLELLGYSRPDGRDA